MRERMGRPSWSSLALLMLLGVLTGCTKPEDGTMTAGATTAMPQGAALYGVNVDVSYTGDRTALGEPAMVYVFLRKPGTRMPLAVQHFAASELPRTVSFAGSGPEDAVELVVRLSPSGRVDRSPEDVEFSRVLPGLLHPPQTIPVALGDSGAAEVAVSPHTPAAPATPVALRTSVSMEGGGPFGPDAVVFVIAKRPDQPMPVAVKRLSVGDLPADIELSDADAMSFGNRLSDAGTLEVFARISASGTASRSDADWISDTVKVDTSNIPEAIPLAIHAPAGG